jgi:hypothetical protein
LSAPKPDVIERLADKAQANLYPSAFGRAQHGGGERVKTSSEPNLGDLMVGGVAAVRRDVEDAASQLFEAYRRVELAQARLNDAASRIDSKAPVTAEQHERAIAHPADRGDVERAKKAQGRRASRAMARRLPWSREEVSG